MLPAPWGLSEQLFVTVYMRRSHTSMSFGGTLMLQLSQSAHLVLQGMQCHAVLLCFDSFVVGQVET